MIKLTDKNKARIKRHARIRNKITGTTARPRLAVFRSAKEIYAQLINDEDGITVAAASTLEKSFSGYGGNIDAAKKIGALIAERGKEKGVESVVFDRSGYIYHGRVAALAEGAREGGLVF
ncbi:MAG: 50S ribosomal protein L18 [Oscillospiraceae bacterium]|jgi:large subunit ribosomal protein L18|nr:50S ribosomal protein L18 [Oscillospiraceae bacterium]